MNLGLAILLSGLGGFVALSYELVWFRVVNYASSETAAAFSLLLGSYLLGLAIGSLAAQLLADRDIPGLQVVGGIAFVSAMVGFFSCPMIAFFLSLGGGFWSALFMVVVGSAFLGIQFPLLAHYGIDPDERVGRRVSWLYAANIVGSVSGTILTGFLLFDIWTLAEVTAALTTMTLFISLFAFFASRPSKKILFLSSGAVLTGAVIVWSSYAVLYDGLYERLMLWDAEGIHFVKTYETRGGTISISDEDTLFSSGVYDGRFKVDLVDDTNRTFRAFLPALLQKAPKRVLIIGMASGSWAVPAANAPGVEEVVIVEINPGYFEVIGTRDPQKKLLTDPKVTLVEDDARRWLDTHPDEKFDVVLANMTYHFRSHASMLLSREFTQIIADHLTEEGAYYMNTTGFHNAHITGMSVFPHSLHVKDLFVGSKSPIAIDRDHFATVLENYQIYGEPVFDLTQPAHKKAYDGYMKEVDDHLAGNNDGLFSRRESIEVGDLDVITDDNMLGEFRWLYVPRGFWLDPNFDSSGE